MRKILTNKLRFLQWWSPTELPVSVPTLSCRRRGSWSGSKSLHHARAKCRAGAMVRGDAWRNPRWLASQNLAGKYPRASRVVHSMCIYCRKIHMLATPKVTLHFYSACAHHKHTNSRVLSDTNSHTPCVSVFASTLQVDRYDCVCIDVCVCVCVSWYYEPYNRCSVVQATLSPVGDAVEVHFIVVGGCVMRTILHRRRSQHTTSKGFTRSTTTMNKIVSLSNIPLCMCARMWSVRYNLTYIHIHASIEATWQHNIYAKVSSVQLSCTLARSDNSTIQYEYKTYMSSVQYNPVWGHVHRITTTLYSMAALV